jgi:predicted aspartyl protease
VEKMKGFIDEYGQAIINIGIIGNRGKISIRGVIDTEFDGDICIPVPIAIQLGLELRDIVCVK